MEFFSILHGVNMALGVVLVVLTFGFLLFSDEEE